MIAHARRSIDQHKNLFAGVISVSLVTFLLAGILFFSLPVRGIKGKLKVVYYWTTASLSRIYDRFQEPSGQPLAPIQRSAATGPLHVDSDNPRYFADVNGNIIYLTGSHTWSNFQDNGGGYPPPVFDYNAYLDFQVKNNHNFFRLWTWEESRWTSETTDDNYWFFPAPPFQRTGPGTALDGQPKFDLSKWDQAYFDRLRQRVIDAGNRGIYVSVMLFNGWSISQGDPQYGAGKNNPWKGHPFNKDNNINGINGDVNNNQDGREVHTLSNPAVTAIQDAYVKKVIDTVNDQNNVLYEICNECGTDSKDWEYHMIDLIHTYEKGKPKQHPVGMTHIGDDAALRASPADWISITNAGSPIPPVADGVKVSLLDTDHICGVCGDRAWVWEAFTMGHNPIFMDAYDGASYGGGGAGFVFNDPRWVSARANMGYARTYANRMNLAAMIPHPDLCSTGYCLASTTEYLAYLPSGGSITMNLNATSGPVTVEWFNPEMGTTVGAGSVDGNATRTFTAPFSGDAVLYLSQTSSPPQTPVSTPIQTGTVLPVTLTPMDTSITPTPKPASSLPCIQGLLVLGGLFLVVIQSGSFYKNGS